MRVGTKVAAAAALTGGVAVGAALLSGCDGCEAATSLLLSGVVPGKCTVVVNADAQALNLPVAITGSYRVPVGSLVQDCTGTRSYTLGVSSMNCGIAPLGGKLLGDDPAERVSYSVEFTNPATGGSQTTVTNLLASACTNQIGRQVTDARITNETSSVFVNFSGNPDLAAGTYQDVLTISLTMN